MERIIVEPIGGDFLRISRAGEEIGRCRITIDGDHGQAELISAPGAEWDPSVVTAVAEEVFSRASSASFSPAGIIPAEKADSRLDQKAWAQEQPLTITRFEAKHAEGVSALCRGEGWKSYADPAVAGVGCAAPGVTTLVAVNEETGTVAGFSQVLSDGIVQGYLAQLIVHPAYRRIGLARTLVTKVYSLSGAQRLDLQTDDAQAFYETFVGHKKPSYRIYPDR